MAGIELIDIHKTYRVDNREIPVLNGINLSLPAGRITVILGQSGCGKTTLLRLTGGLETADSGEIRWESAHKTAFVFQEPRLMPWLTVWENVVFGLSKKETDPGKIEAVIRTVGLSGFEKAYPAKAWEQPGLLHFSLKEQLMYLLLLYSKRPIRGCIEISGCCM